MHARCTSGQRHLLPPQTDPMPALAETSIPEQPGGGGQPASPAAGASSEVVFGAKIHRRAVRGQPARGKHTVTLPAGRVFLSFFFFFERLESIPCYLIILARKMPRVSPLHLLGAAVGLWVPRAPAEPPRTRQGAGSRTKSIVPATEVDNLYTKGLLGFPNKIHFPAG